MRVEGEGPVGMVLVDGQRCTKNHNGRQGSICRGSCELCPEVEGFRDHCHSGQWCVGVEEDNKQLYRRVTLEEGQGSSKGQEVGGNTPWVARRLDR